MQDKHELGRLESGHKNPVNSVLEAEKRIKDMFSKFESSIAAFQRRPPPAAPGGGGGGDGSRTSQLPTPDSSFDGCWHCSKKHKGGSRQCPEFRALLKKNGGKLPSNYDDKSLRLAGKQVNALVNAQEDAAFVQQAASPQAESPTGGNNITMIMDSEHPETIPDEMFFAVVDTTPKDFTDKNYWVEFAIADEGDDAEIQEVVNAVSQRTANVSTGNKTQTQKKLASKGPPPLSKKQIAAIAKKLESGELTLPDLELPTDQDYCAIWALVDSGSSVHVVDVAKTFPGAKIKAPVKGSKGFTCANGSKNPDKGSCIVPFKTIEGRAAAVQWKNAEVAMPILSTKELARNKRKVVYAEDEGEIIHPDGGDPSKFLAAHGVYFMKLLVPKHYVMPGLLSSSSSPNDPVCGVSVEGGEEEALVTHICKDGRCHGDKPEGVQRPGP